MNATSSVNKDLFFMFKVAHFFLNMSPLVQYFYLYIFMQTPVVYR
jgi:hypothetical protein